MCAQIQLRTLLPQRNLTASIVTRHHRQTIQLNDEVVVSHPDLIVMDGVVHKIDRVLLPAPLAQEDGYKGAEKAGSRASSSVAWLWPWSKHGSEIGVLELMERLQPYLIEAN